MVSIKGGTVNEQESLVRFTLRMPRKLHRQMVRLAGQEQRSLNGQIVHLLNKAIQDKEKADVHD